MTSTDRTLDVIADYTHWLRGDLPAAKAVLRARINRIDGHTTGTDAPKVSHTAELTTVEAAAARRIHLANTLDDLDDRLYATASVLRHLHDDIVKIIGDRADVPRCDGGTGREGYLLPKNEGGWSHPDCTNVPSDGFKTCDRCRKAASRWARIQAAAS